MKPEGVVLGILLAGALVAATLAAAQQPTKIAVGYLGTGAAPTPGTPNAGLEAFRHGLAALGYVEGQGVVIETRWAGGQTDQLPALAAELVGLKVDVIVGVGLVVARAAKRATTNTPVVVTVVADLVEAGVVASLERPGGNITGVSTFDPQEARKNLELLKEVLPGLANVAVLGDQGVPGYRLKAHEEQARALGLRPQGLQIAGTSPDLEGVFQAMRDGAANALLVLEQPATVFHRRRIAEMATKQRLPTLFAIGSSDAGGLISYGTSATVAAQRMAAYVDKIVKGAKPADLPIEVVVRHELIVNLKTAQEIGVTIPPVVLKRANRLIQ